MINRGQLDRAAEDEFQHLITQIRGVFLKEHNEDGTHFIKPNGFDFVPIGFIGDWPSDTPPSGWLPCDGRQLSRAKYAALFSVIGVTYGVGDGSTTFNLPDRRGRFSLSKAATGTGSTLGATGGAIDHTHAGGSHTHAITADGAHDHGGSTGNAGAHDHGGNVGLESGHTHGFSATTSVGSTLAGAFSAGSSFSQVDHTHTVSGTTAGGSAHSHPITGVADHAHAVNAQAAHDHGGVTGAASGSTGSANPPFLVTLAIINTGVA